MRTIPVLSDVRRLPSSQAGLCLMLSLAACARSGFVEHPCTAQACSGHGVCVVTQVGSALCACDPGFSNQGPLACAGWDSGIADAGPGDRPTGDAQHADRRADDLFATADAAAGDASSAEAGPPPPAPRQLVTTPDSDTSFSVFWLGGGGNTATYRLAWIAGTIPPADCHSGNVVASAALAGDSYQISGGLQPWTEYSVRLCAVSDGDVLSAESLTATQRTLPTCDQTVLSDESFVAFQARIDASLDANGDGRRTICIADGVEVATRSAADGATLTLTGAGDFTTICARRGDDARITNYRTDSTGFPTMSALRVWQGEQAQLANLRLEAFGTNGECIDGQLSDGSVGFTEITNLDCAIHGTDADALNFTSRPVGAIKDIRITVDGPASKALVFGGANQTVEDFARFTFNLSTDCSNSGCAFDLHPGADFSRIRWGTITGTLGNGYVWDQNDAHVGVLEDVTVAFDRPGFRVAASSIDEIRRLDIGVGGGGVIWLRNGATLGALVESVLTVTGAATEAVRVDTGASIGAMRDVQLQKTASAQSATATALVISDDAWVVSPQVVRVVVCSAAGALYPWEQHPTSPGHGLLKSSDNVPPTTHTPFSAGTVLGAQTFPFDRLDGAGAQGGAVAAQEIVLGGPCP